MPERIVRLRFIEIITTPVVSKFDDVGAPIQLLAPLNRTVTAKEMAPKDPDLNQLYTKLNDFQPGLGDSLFQSNLKAESSINIKQTIFATEYGLTPRISLGFMVPVVEMDVKSSFSATTVSQADAVAAKVKGIGPLEDGVNQFKARTPNTATFEDAIFTSRGYSLPGDFTKKGLGDAEVGAKYLIYKGDELTFSAQGQVRLPTTTKAENYARLLDKSLGDGQTDLGAYFYLDYTPNHNLIFATSAKLTAQLADKQYRPVNRYGETDLPDLTDPSSFDTVNRKLGNMLDTEVSASYLFGEQAYTLFGMYQFSMKGRDSYSGSKDYLDYDTLAADTSLTAHHYELGFGYSTIPMYFKKKFPLPFELRASFNSLFAGKNTPKAAYTRLNLHLYF